MDLPLASIKHIRVRGNYTNKRTILSGMKKHLEGKDQGDQETSLAPIVELLDGKRQLIQSFVIRESDIPFLCQPEIEEAIAYLKLFLQAQKNIPSAMSRLHSMIQSYFYQRGAFFKNIPSQGSEFLVPSTCSDEYPAEMVSNKGATLLELSNQNYPVPDFVVLTSNFYKAGASQRSKHIEEAIRQLERLTSLEIGSAKRPLIFALRCAMPCYMPGVMPTFLNVGVTESAIPALVSYYGEEAAAKIVLNNFKNILFVIDKKGCKDLLAASFQGSDSALSAIEQFLERIKRFDPSLVTDPYRQTAFFVNEAFRYYENNKDLILSVSKGEEHFPSLILQNMICTVRNENSQAGVLYSRHPRAGVGRQIESARNIFGEEIMAGSVEAIRTNFQDKDEIKNDFPAVYHFVPALSRLEAYFQSPVTIEYVTDITDRHEFFALIQLNPSEMTGRSAIISVMDLFNQGIISQHRVSELIRPYHIKQIESDAIDPESFKELTVFSRAASVLPRSAVLAQMYFSPEEALKQKKKGKKVCLLKKSFEPSDTFVMGEVDAIASLTSAAIHVVTICQSYGLPALLNLEKNGVQLADKRLLVNAAGQEIREGDWITVSSRNRCIYKGRAKFRPARLIRYMSGQKVELEEDEVEVFAQMAKAYGGYNELVKNLKLDQILSLTELIRLVILEFRGETERAKSLVNNWFDHNKDLYVDGVFTSDMGDHLKQHTVFNLLTLDRKIKLFKIALKKCIQERITGYSAGAFMLGRFICLSQPVKFWKSFSFKELAVLANEWLLFEKYMQILHDSGERKIRYAKKKILQEGLSPLHLSPKKVKILIPLKLSKIPLEPVKKALPSWCDPQTKTVLELLREPYSSFFDYSHAWSIQELKRICAEENLPLPPPDSV